MLADDWFTVEKIDESTYAISEYGHWEQVHSFLLLGKKKAMLIDTGLGIDNIKRMTDQITNLPVFIMTTHVHWDHIGSHGQFDEIYVHEGDKDWLVNGINGLPIEQIRKDVGRDITKPTPKTFDLATYLPHQGEPTGIVADEHRFNLGDRIVRVLHTPGHSPGHVALFDETKGYLFTGDLLYADEPVYAFYPSTNPVALVNSLERIASLTGVRKIYGSHHTLGLNPAILTEVNRAVDYLRENDLTEFGTGIHTFNGFSVQF